MNVLPMLAARRLDLRIASPFADRLNDRTRNMEGVLGHLFQANPFLTNVIDLESGNPRLSAGLLRFRAPFSHRRDERRPASLALRKTVELTVCGVDLSDGSQLVFPQDDTQEPTLLAFLPFPGNPYSYVLPMLQYGIDWKLGAITGLFARKPACEYYYHGEYPKRHIDCVRGTCKGDCIPRAGIEHDYAFVVECVCE
jgi:hypothetical protein